MNTDPVRAHFAELGRRGGLKRRGWQPTPEQRAALILRLARAREIKAANDAARKAMNP